MIGIKEKYLMQSNEFFYRSLYYLWICLAMIYIQNSFTVQKSVENIKENYEKSIKILIKNS